MSLVGVALGILGIYLLVGQRSILEQENAILGMIMIFACMLSWAYGSLFIGKADMPKNYVVNTGYQMFTGGLMLLLTSFAFQETWIPYSEWSGEVRYSMLLLIIFGSIIAFSAFNFLLKTVSPEKVATNTYVNPIVAMLLGWYFLEEEISNQSILAAVLLMTGV